MDTATLEKAAKAAQARRAELMPGGHKPEAKPWEELPGDVRYRWLEAVKAAFRVAGIEVAECECIPGQVCASCAARGYKNGLAGYIARIHPEQVTQADIDEQERADRAREL